MKNKFLLFFMLSGLTALANVSLPSFFSDNMVLQRNSEVTIWGWGDPMEEVTIQAGWTQETYKTKTTNHAVWHLKIKTPGAGGPYTVSIKGYNEVALNNVMLGEVWLCSGQSNMDWNANAGIDNAAAEIALANHPNIRLFSVPKLSASHPQINVPGNWKVCTPETMKHFSAVGYFFAQHLQEELKGIPIGLINSSWGGTHAEIWMPEEAFEANRFAAEAASKLQPVDWGPIEPASAWNAMIHPFIPFKLAGVLWYQGENNVGSELYAYTLAQLIQSWRIMWQDEMPFYYVQIAPYKYGEDHFYGAIIRDAQRRVLNAVPKTGMVVTGDISPTDEIHPRNKKTVGVRLANLALQSQYGGDIGLVNGPLYKNVTFDKNKAIVYFDYAEGLYFKNKTSGQFEVAGSDGVFHPAEAKIKGTTLIISSKQVKQPVKVRYAWRNTAQPDLFNKAGLPASSFITD